MTSQVLRHIGPTVRRAVARILGHGHPEIDDTTQEALLAFVVAWRAFRGECHPAGYAARIAIRQAIRARRRVRLRYRLARELSESYLVEASALADERRDPFRHQLLLSLLEGIPAAQREALVQRSVHELSLEEIATMSGAPLNTVRSRVRMAREAMQSLIRARPGLLEDVDIATLSNVSY